MKGGIATVSSNNGAPDRSVQEDLHGFATRVLEQCGGLVDWESAETPGAAILPPDLAKRLGVAESLPLASRPLPGALCVSLASEFLDQSETLLESLVPRMGAFQIPDHYLKGGDLQQAIDQLFTWHNARVRLRTTAPREVEYHAWSFFASVKSEDVWESQLTTTINASSLVPVDLPDLLTQGDLEPAMDDSPVDSSKTFDAAARVVQSRLLRDASGFFARTESRLDRDRKRLRDYYGALQRDTGGSKRKGVTPPTAEETESRKRAVVLELQRKLAELDERYQIDASLKPITVVSVRLKALVVELLVQRKKNERVHQVYWNPLSKKFEPMCCSNCGQGTFSVAFTDADVSALCAHCHEG